MDKAEHSKHTVYDKACPFCLEDIALGGVPGGPRTPYPWCHGSPTREECARRGYCNRDPNCGE